jgi:hypothetical protein
MPFHEDSCGPYGPYGLLELAANGAHLAWLTFDDGGNHLYLNLQATSGTRVGMPHAIATGGNLSCAAATCDYAGEGDLHGDGALLVFDTWQQRGGPCEYHSCFREDKINGTLWRVQGSRAVEVRSEPEGLTALSVDRGRIAVLTSRGTIEVLTADGSIVRMFAFRPDDIDTAALSGGLLVVQHGNRVDVYDVGSGRLQTTRSFRGQRPRLTDAESGIATYVSGIEVHVLRLSDGKDLTIEPPGSRPVLAQIESTGVLYSYASHGRYRGRVVFVPFRTLARRLG